MTEYKQILEAYKLKLESDKIIVDNLLQGIEVWEASQDYWENVFKMFKGENK